MTYEDREQIFSKEILHISDIQKLFGCAQSTASAILQSWKRKILFSGKDLRINLDGKIHIMDYFDVMNINPQDPGERYYRKKPEDIVVENQETEAPVYHRRSVCM